MLFRIDLSKVSINLTRLGYILRNTYVSNNIKVKLPYDTKILFDIHTTHGIKKEYAIINVTIALYRKLKLHRFDVNNQSLFYDKIKIKINTKNIKLKRLKSGYYLIHNNKFISPLIKIPYDLLTELIFDFEYETVLIEIPLWFYDKYNFYFINKGVI